MSIGWIERVPVVLRVEFLKLHAGHKLLGGEVDVVVLLLRSSSLLVLLGLGVQMMWVLRRPLVVVHHTPRHHLVRVWMVVPH